MRPIRILAVLVLAAGLMIPSAQATILEKDLNIPGDKLLTVVPSTGLEWLDVTATLGLSYDEALGTTFVTTQGFRHANTNEVSALYIAFGIINQTGSAVAVNFAGTQSLLALMGCTFQCESNTIRFQRGFGDFVPFSSTIDSISVAELLPSAGVAGSLVTLQSSFKSSSNISVGIILSVLPMMTTTAFWILRTTAP